MKKNHLFVFFLFIILMFVISCTKDADDDALKDDPCYQIIDHAIKFDTIWKIPINGDYRILSFSEKYFLISKALRELTIYNAETGEVISVIGNSEIPDFYTSRFILRGDKGYFRTFSPNKIFIYDIENKTINQIEQPELVHSLTFDENRFYGISDKTVLGFDYDGNMRDTIATLLYSDLYIIPHMRVLLYDLPEVLNTSFLAIAFEYYNKDSFADRAIQIAIINLATGKIDWIFKLPYALWNSVDFYTANNMLFFNIKDYVFIYDFIDNRYFIFKTEFSKRQNVFATHSLSTPRGNIPASVFFNNEQLSSYNFIDGNLQWNCRELKGSNMSMISLVRPNGNVEHLLAYMNKFVYFSDIGSGTVKAIFDVPKQTIKEISRIDREGYFLARTDEYIYKIQIALE